MSATRSRQKPRATSRTVLGVPARRCSSRGEGSTVVSGTVGQTYGLTGARSPLAAQAGYAGFGAGVYGADLNGAHAFARPGAYAEAGYNVTETLFVNAQYRLVDRAGGAALTLARPVLTQFGLVSIGLISRRKP